MFMNVGGLAIYIRKKRLYIIRIKNANYDTKMAYFDERHPALRIKKEGSNYILVKENIPFEFPLGRKMEDLLLFDQTKNLTNPYEVIKNKLVLHVLDLTGHKYDLYDDAAILREEIRRILNENTTTHGLLFKSDLEKLVYDKLNGKLKKEFEEIRYFFPSMDLSQKSISVFSYVMVGDEIAGLSKLEKNPYQKNVWWISFISVREKYQGKGYSKILIEELFKFAKKNKIKILGSSRTEQGSERLPKTIEKYSKEYGVEYIPS
jgi:hypothetical protein